MQKTFRYFSVAVIAAGLVAIAGAATPIYVDGAAGLDTNDGVAPGTAVKTIAKGIDLVDAGGIVNVAAGTYTQQIDVVKKVDLRGANADISPNGGVRSAESIITAPSGDFALRFTTGSNDSTLNGFKFTGNSLPILENGTILAKVTTVGDPAVNGITVKNNVIDTNAGNGIQVYGVQGWTIEDNSIKNVTGTTPSGLRLVGITNSLVKKNTIDNTLYAGIIVDNASNLTIEENTISNVVQPGVQVANSPGQVTITKNAITNANTGNGADKAAIAIYANSPTIDATLNNISGSGGAFAVRTSGTGAVASTVHVNNNNFIGNTSPQVRNRAPGGGTLDATNNYWGSAAGPAAADLAEANVTTSPFLTSTAAVSEWSLY